MTETTTESAQATTSAPAATTTETAAAPITTETTQQTTTPPPPAIGPDGTLADKWFLALGDEFAPHAADLGKHKNIRSILTELDYHRKNGAAYPADPTDEKAVSRFRSIAGVPETPEGYQLAESLKLPEGMELDADLAKEISTVAHATHTPPAALKALAAKYTEIIAARAQAQADEHAQAVKESQDALVRDWRGDFQTNAATVRHTITKLAEIAGVTPDDPALAAMVNNPAAARIMLQVSKLTAEDRTTVPLGFGDLRSPAQKIADIKAGNDPVWSPLYNSKNDTEKAKAYQHIKGLYEMQA